MNCFCLSVYLDHTDKASATNLGTFQMERGRTLSQAPVPMAAQAAEFGSLFVLKSPYTIASISTLTMILWLHLQQNLTQKAAEECWLPTDIRI